MNEQRYWWLMNDAVSNGGLTKQEMRDGWHFCPDFDGLLCHFGVTPVLKTCTCTPWTEDQVERFGDDDQPTFDASQGQEGGNDA